LRKAILTSRNPIPQAASFIRRTAWERVGGVGLGLAYLMDWDLWLRMGRAGCRFKYEPEVWANARLHEASKSICGGLGIAEALVSIMNGHMMGDTTDLGLSAIARRQALSSAHLVAAEELFHDAYNREIRRHLARAFRLCPWNLLLHLHIQLWLGCFLSPKMVRRLRSVKSRFRQVH
jgi:hypothetical protein